MYIGSGIYYANLFEGEAYSIALARVCGLHELQNLFFALTSTELKFYDREMREVAGDQRAESF